MISVKNVTLYEDFKNMSNGMKLIGNEIQNVYEPGHEKLCLMSYANNKGADQPAHQRSLISAFVVRCLDSIIAEISRT